MNRRVVSISVLMCLGALSGICQSADPPRFLVQAAPVAGMTEWDHRNLERNLRWMLLRAQAPGTGPARVAVFADAGVWHVGARSIVEALERDGIACRVLDRSQLTANVLNTHEALILPGGWAPFQWAAAGQPGLQAIKSYVERGGRCLGICAGAYLISRETRYDGKVYPYPLGLFDGAAEGPIAGLAAFPKPGAVAVTPTDAGKRRGLAILIGHSAYYSGGPRFVGGSGIEILARYPDGTAAAIAKPVGKGEVLLLGMHYERPETGGDDAATPAIAGTIFQKLLFKTTD